MSFQKILSKELISAGSSQAFFAGGLSWMVSENWFVVFREKIRNIFLDE